MSPIVYAIATMDSKGEEIRYVADCLRKANVRVQTVDVGTLGEPPAPPDVKRETVLGDRELPTSGHRGEAIAVMGQALGDWLVEQDRHGKIAGVIGIGGSGGTSLISTAMRRLPIGRPKLLVSTVASGNTAPYVDCCDLILMYSVVDIAGLNSVSRVVLTNAANAMSGMVLNSKQAESRGGALGMTMFGVTTPCVDAVRQHLESKGQDCLVFHATGAGGRAMEKLVESDLIQGVLDITTTEVADEVVGGVFPAGPRRFDALLRKSIPLVLSVGAVDMVNFGGLETVPSEFRQRNLHVHNEQVTLMRTSIEENEAIASWIAAKLNSATAPWTMVLPLEGVSLLDQVGQPFHAPEANAALFFRLEQELELNSHRQLVKLPYHINDPEFASALVQHYEHLAKQTNEST